jgi:hypothetical protein
MHKESSIFTEPKESVGRSAAQLHITPEGDFYLRMVFVKGTEHVLGTLLLAAVAVMAQDQLLAIGLDSCLVSQRDTRCPVEGKDHRNLPPTSSDWTPTGLLMEGHSVG